MSKHGCLFRAAKWRWQHHLQEVIRAPTSSFIVQKENKKTKVALVLSSKDEKTRQRTASIIEYADKEFELDLSLNCQMRWEKHFPTQAEKRRRIILVFTQSG